MDPQDHVKEFCVACIKVAHNETYLMRLFPQSFGGQTMEWFSKLPLGIKSFNELVDIFVTHYSYNIRHEVTMFDFCNAKQKNGEPFLTFLQIWHHLLSKYPRIIPEHKRMESLIQNLTPYMSYRVEL